MNKRSTFQIFGKTFSLSKKVVVLSSVAAVLLVLILAMLIILGTSGEEPDPTEPSTEPSAPTETTEAPTEPSTEDTVPTEPGMLEDMAAIYQENPDVAGWITIGDTKLDYPVMFTPDDEDKYLYLDFDEKDDAAGLPYLDADCSLDPESDNLIIYGHNMNDGRGFHTIMEYEKEEFWKEHPTFTYKTLYEERTYEVVAAFRDRVYYNYEDNFRFYRFVNIETEEEWDAGIAYFKEMCPYDTGITPEYGDHLITLVTCAYHHQYGRFVVVARLVTDDAEPTETTAPVN